MDINDIRNSINSLLQGDGRQIVFWYDEDGGYRYEIENGFSLDNGAKVWILTGDNSFETKLQIERRDKDSDYLIYAPFARPSDKDNILADMYYYSKHFYSDKLVQIMGDIGIPAECLDEMKRFKRFWSSGNVEKFKALQIDEYTPEDIDLGIICVLANVKTTNFEELIRKMLLGGLEDNASLKKMQTYKIDGFFWQCTAKYYGYRDEEPTLRRFLITMMITYMDVVTEGKAPEVWRSFISLKKNDCVIFMKNFMNSDETRGFYDDFAEHFSDEKNVASVFREIPLDDLYAFDALPQVDEDLIGWMISKIEDGMPDERVVGMTIPEICDERTKPAYHYSDRYHDSYMLVKNAHQVYKLVTLHIFRPTIDEVVKDYADNAYLIDRHYRMFYYYLDKVGNSEETDKLRGLVENIYTNKYLTDYSFKWNQILTDEVYRDYTGSREEDFFENYVRPFMNEDSREGRVVVIISDGMRYEVGRELYEDLELDEKCKAQMHHMLSVIPSETTLGMASLLPHKDIQVDTELNVTVDGMKCGNSMADRQKILQKYVPDAICVSFDFLKNEPQDKVRALFQNKNLIYAYQNQIDVRGEKRESENEVFNACEEAVNEIKTVIHRLTGFVSVTRYLVTADHGFIYKRDKLAESDKISMDKSALDTTNYRYLLSDHKVDNEALTSRCLAYLSAMNKAYVTTPKGTDIIKQRAGGMNYVHGGSSLQEMIVPVIKVNTLTGKQTTDLVNVELNSFITRVTNSVFTVDFMQMEPVTDKVKPRKLVAFFIDADGQKISFDVPIIANIRDTDASKRVISERFTLKSGHYNSGQDYYLVLADMDDESNVIQKYKYTIDIMDM